VPHEQAVAELRELPRIGPFSADLVLCAEQTTPTTFRCTSHG